MSKNTKNKHYKEYLRLLRESDKLYEIKSNLGYIELDKPIHNGYIAKYVLRDDIARRDDADFLAYMVETYTKPIWCKNSLFIVKRGKHSISYYEPTMVTIDELSYHTLSEKAKKYFYRDYQNRISWGGVEMKRYTFFIDSYMIVKHIEKDYITHRKVIDGDLISQESFLDYKMDEILYSVTSPWEGIKGYSKIKNRSDRAYNKRALKYNLNTLVQNPEDESYWFEYGSDWMDDTMEYKYKSKGEAKWMRW